MTKSPLYILLVLLAGAAPIAQAASENLDGVDNSTVATAQDVGAIALNGSLNVFGYRGTSFGGSVVDNDLADFYKFTVTGSGPIGLTLQVDTSGGPQFLNDPIVGLFNESGSLLRVDDDAGDGFDSLLTFTASTGGTFYAAVSGFSDFNFADSFGNTNFPYNLTITAGPPGPVDPNPVVPIPAAVWLFASAVLGLVSFSRKA